MFERLAVRNLKQASEAVIENGVLMKWRYDGEASPMTNKKYMDKVNSGEALTNVELEFVMATNNVLVVDNQKINLFNFDVYRLTE